MPYATIPFPWYLLVHEDDDTALIVSADKFDMVVIFTDVEFAQLYAQRSGSNCRIQEFSDPETMIDFFEQLIEAASIVEDRPITYACFDPIEPQGGSGVSAFSIKSLLAGLKKATE